MRRQLPTLPVRQPVEADPRDDLLHAQHVRPRTRGDCLPRGCNEERPCPWVSCRHHLGLDVSPQGGVLVIEGWDEGGASCSLDVADRGGATLEEIGELLGVSRERVRQIEVMALIAARRAAPEDDGGT